MVCTEMDSKSLFVSFLKLQIILTISNTDSFEIFNFPIQALSIFDTFQFCHFQILNHLNPNSYQEKCICALSNSNTFQALAEIIKLTFPELNLGRNSTSWSFLGAYFENGEWGLHNGLISSAGLKE